MRLLLCAVLLAASSASASAASCSARIAYVQRVIDKDVKVGYVDKTVHDTMMNDLAAATQACNAGDNAKAGEIISSTQRRHGYPVR